jgi:hypothetical protein
MAKRFATDAGFQVRQLFCCPATGVSVCAAHSMWRARSIRDLGVLRVAARCFVPAHTPAHWVQCDGRRSATTRCSCLVRALCCELLRSCVLDACVLVSGGLATRLTASLRASVSRLRAGGYGYLKDYPIERYLRDVRVHQVISDEAPSVCFTLAVILSPPRTHARLCAALLVAACPAVVSTVSVLLIRLGLLCRFSRAPTKS